MPSCAVFIWQAAIMHWQSTVCVLRTVRKESTLSDGAATGKMFDDFEYLASNGIKSYWNDNYSLIHKVKWFVWWDEPKLSLTEGDLVNKGEALFVRAFCYFNLVRAFGEVPWLTLKFMIQLEANVPKSSVAKDIWINRFWPYGKPKTVCPERGSNFMWVVSLGELLVLFMHAYMMRNDWGIWRLPLKKWLTPVYIIWKHLMKTYLFEKRWKL